MLVLSREIGQSLLIGHDIKITLLDIRGARKARIGIECPAGLPVDREEVRALPDYDPHRRAAGVKPEDAGSD